MRFTELFCPALALLLLSFPPRAHGALLSVSNPSFETPPTANGTFNTSDTSAPSGWSIYSGIMNSGRHYGVLNPNGTTLYSDPVPDGSNVGVVFLFTQGEGEGGLEQTLGDSLQLNTQYTLTVDVGNIANDAAPPHNTFNFAGFPGYRLELRAGGTVLASDNNTLSPAEGRFLTSTVQFGTGAFHANAGEALGIRLVNLNGPGIEVNFDNVRLDAVAVPEPSAYAAALGTLCLFVALFRKGLRPF